MFEYKFIKHPIKKLKTNSKTTDETVRQIQEIIRIHAEDGWRFVQIFSPVGEGLISVKHYEIILERQLQDK